MLNQIKNTTIWLIEPLALQRYVATRATTNRAYSAPVLDLTQGNVAVLDVRGVMVPDAEYSDEVDTVVLANLITEAKDNPAVSALVLNIDSPGGVVQGMTQLMEAAADFAERKPLYAYAQYCMCSAAYWLASAAEKIYTGADADVGSVGVRINLWDWSGYFEQHGIKVITADTGPLKSLGVLGEEITEAQKASLQERVDTNMQAFMGSVQESRSLSAEQRVEVATAKVFMASQAQAVGLTDGIASLSDVVAMASDSTATITPGVDAMSEDNKSNEPVAATLPELKEALPEAGSDFVLAQLEASATIADALKSYNSHLVEQNKALAESEAKANAQAEKAKAKAEESDGKAKRGNASIETEDGEESETPQDFVQMAQELAKEKGVSFKDAAHRIKKRYPEARESFKGQTLPV